MSTEEKAENICRSIGIAMYVQKEDAESLADRLEERYPDLEVSVKYGGQPLYYYILSVE